MLYEGTRVIYALNIGQYSHCHWIVKAIKEGNMARVQLSDRVLALPGEFTVPSRLIQALTSEKLTLATSPSF